MEETLTFFDLLELSKEPKLTKKLSIKVRNNVLQYGEEAEVTRVRPFDENSLEVGYIYPTGWGSYAIVTPYSIRTDEVVIYTEYRKQKRGRGE